jgi:hypothetical protein
MFIFYVTIVLSLPSNNAPLTDYQRLSSPIILHYSRDNVKNPLKICKYSIRRIKVVESNRIIAGEADVC